uniref:Sulfotransferase n=1 Tax=Gossypium raimondii TaxID=29730 RepID=A0A0D2QBR0_GOSRA|nr:hypothetical protein B456_002G250000 [Gossypium raimondii]
MPKPGDIFLCSAPKSGTTWLKALSFAIVTRNLYDTSNSPLLTKGPHYCVPNMVGFEHKPDIRQPAKQRPRENEHISIEEAFELFCQGRSVFGPAWDHILAIGKLVKNDRKSFEEEQGGLVKKLIDLCSFENLSNLDVNKTGNDMKTTMRQRTRRSSEKARLEIGKTILHPRWLIGSTI